MEQPWAWVNYVPTFCRSSVSLYAKVNNWRLHLLIEVASSSTTSAQPGKSLHIYKLIGTLVTSPNAGGFLFFLVIRGCGRKLLFLGQKFSSDNHPLRRLLQTQIHLFMQLLPPRGAGVITAVPGWDSGKNNRLLLHPPSLPPLMLCCWSFSIDQMWKKEVIDLYYYNYSYFCEYYKYSYTTTLSCQQPSHSYKSV